MHFRLRTGTIIGLGVWLFLLSGWMNHASAIFSPVLNDEVVKIRQHIVAARQQNGAGTWLNAMDKVEQANKEAKAQGKSTGIPGGFYLYDEALKEIVVQSVTESFLSGISLLFGSAADTKSPISTCLRDDIWQLQALQEEVLNELFKSALLNDDVNSRLLWADYNRLKGRIEGKEKDPIRGIRNTWKNTEEWFPGEGINYYGDECPSGEFTTAIEELVRTVKSLGSQTSVTLGSFADIPAIAKKRAKIKAADYIARNQIKVSLGGNQGANPTGLINGNGIAGLGAKLKTEYKIMTEVLDLICSGVKWTDAVARKGLAIPPDELVKLMGGSKCLDQINLQSVLPEIGQVASAYQRNLENRKVDESRLKAALRFNIELDNVSEEGLIGIERELVAINAEIKKAPGPDALKEMCNQVRMVLTNQCKNKNKEPEKMPKCE